MEGIFFEGNTNNIKLNKEDTLKNVSSTFYIKIINLTLQNLINITNIQFTKQLLCNKCYKAVFSKKG